MIRKVKDFGSAPNPSNPSNSFDQLAKLTAENGLVLEYLKRRARPEAEVISPPGDRKRDYWDLGSHPDIVERVWDKLGSGLRDDCRVLVYGNPVLIAPDTLRILAVAIGTSYAVRLPPNPAGAPPPEGFAAVIKWSGGSALDLASEFGPDWIVGKWRPEEADWCRERVVGSDFST